MNLPLIKKDNMVRINAASTMYSGDLTINLFFDIDQNDKIKNCGFEFNRPSPWLKSFHQFSTLILDKKINQIDEIANKLFGGEIKFLQLFSSAVTNFREVINHAKFPTEEDSNQLICRCFGVTSNDINRYKKAVKEFNENEENKEVKVSSWLEFQNDFRAGIGCASCVGDFGQMFDLQLPETRHRIAGKSNAEWIVAVDLAFKNFVEVCPKEYESIEVKIEKLENMQLFISVSDEFNNEKTLKTLQNYLSHEVYPFLSVFFV